MDGTTYEVHSHVAGRWRMESTFDEKELAQVAAGMLLDEHPEVDRVRVVEEIQVPGGKPKFRIVLDRDRLETSAPTPKPAKPAAAPAPPPRRPAPTMVGATLPRRPRPPAPPPPPPLKPGAAPLPARKTPGKPNPAATKAASRFTSQIILYFLVAAGLLLGALAAMTFAKQLIRLL